MIFLSKKDRYYTSNRIDFLVAHFHPLRVVYYTRFLHKVLIHAVYPRKTIIERQAIGSKGEKQIIATNIDFAFIVQAVEGGEKM